MKTRNTAPPLQTWRGVLAVSLIVLILFGCMTEKKVNKWNDKHPLQAAEYAAKKFPLQVAGTTVKVSEDSSDFVLGMGELTNSIVGLRALNDSLLRTLLTDTSMRSRTWAGGRIESDTNVQKFDTTVILSATNVQNFSQTVSALYSRLNDSITAVMIKLSQIKPKVIRVDSIITQIDSSKAVATRLLNDKLQREVSQLEKENSSIKSTSKIRLWMLISSSLLITLLLFLLFKKKSSPIDQIKKKIESL